MKRAILITLAVVLMLPASASACRPSIKWDVWRDGKTYNVELEQIHGENLTAEHPRYVTVFRNGRTRYIEWNSLNTDQYSFRFRKRERRAYFAVSYVENRSQYIVDTIGFTLTPLVFGPPFNVTVTLRTPITRTRFQPEVCTSTLTRVVTNRRYRR